MAGRTFFVTSDEPKFADWAQGNLDIERDANGSIINATLTNRNGDTVENIDPRTPEGAQILEKYNLKSVVQNDGTVTIQTTGSTYTLNEKLADGTGRQTNTSTYKPVTGELMKEVSVNTGVQDGHQVIYYNNKAYRYDDMKDGSFLTLDNGAEIRKTTNPRTGEAQLVVQRGNVNMDGNHVTIGLNEASTVNGEKSTKIPASGGITESYVKAETETNKPKWQNAMTREYDANYIEINEPKEKTTDDTATGTADAKDSATADATTEKTPEKKTSTIPPKNENSQESSTKDNKTKDSNKQQYSSTIEKNGSSGGSTDSATPATLRNNVYEEIDAVVQFDDLISQPNDSRTVETISNSSALGVSEQNDPSAENALKAQAELIQIYKTAKAKGGLTVEQKNRIDFLDQQYSKNGSMSLSSYAHQQVYGEPKKNTYEYTLK